MRIDMATSEWHYLVRPVLPHAGKDKDLPELQSVRVERGPVALYAVATDQYTMAAERHALTSADRWNEGTPPVHLHAAEVAATLKLFPYSKDMDPLITLSVDRAPFALANGNSIDSWALILRRPGDGLSLTLRDRRDPSLITTLTGWRKALLRALTRPRGRSLDGLDIRGAMLARWADAARGTERLRLYTGPEPGQPILITVEQHFAGLLTIPQYLDSPAASRAELPWTGELLPADIGADGERLDDVSDDSISGD